jgi:hypothetical protein
MGVVAFPPGKELPKPTGQEAEIYECPVRIMHIIWHGAISLTLF